MSILQIPQGGVDESFKQTWHKPHDQLSFFFLQLYRCEILPSVITRQSQPTSQSNPPTLYFLNPKNQAWTPHPIIKNKIQMLGSKNPLNLQQPKLIFRAFRGLNPPNISKKQTSHPQPPLNPSYQPLLTHSFSKTIHSQGDFMDHYNSEWKKIRCETPFETINAFTDNFIDLIIQILSWHIFQ
jgi:hypothetical protein